jgi:hypothetical protein
MTKLFGAVLAIALMSSCSSDSTTQSNTKSGTQGATQSITLSTDGSQLVTRITAKGTSVTLDGTFEQGVIARRNADGTISIECHDDQDAADAFAQGTASVRHAEVQ